MRWKSPSVDTPRRSVVLQPGDDDEGGYEQGLGPRTSSTEFSLEAALQVAADKKAGQKQGKKRRKKKR